MGKNKKKQQNQPSQSVASAVEDRENDDGEIIVDELHNAGGDGQNNSDFIGTQQSGGDAQQEDVHPDVIPPSPRGSQIEADPLNESAVLIQPNSHQQRIIQELLLEDDDAPNSARQSDQSADHSTTSTIQQQQPQVQQLSAVAAAVATVTPQVIPNSTQALESYIESLPTPSDAQLPVESQPPAALVPPSSMDEHFTVDIFAQASQGNLLPWAYAISRELISPLTTDHEGYHLIHRAAGFHQLDILIGLVEQNGIPVDLRDKNQQQTALMICSHYGNIRMMKYLIDSGADVNAKDIKQFTPLMNSVMNRFKFQSIYLISKGATLHSLDLDGCTLAHRAAFNNDVEMLQILSQISKESLEELDTLNLAPVGRAITNESHQAFEYLQRTRPISIPNASFKHLGNKCMVKMIEEQYSKQNPKPFTKQWLLTQYAQKPGDMAVFLYAILIGCLYYTFVQLTGVLYYRSDLLHNFCNAIHLLTVILITYVFVFALKMECPSVKFKRLAQTGANIALFDFSSVDVSKINFKYLDRVFGYSQTDLNTISRIEDEDDEVVARSAANAVCKRSKKNIFDWVAALVENERFIEFEKLQSNQVCFECLGFKLPRSHHCEKFDVCVPFYSHYSEVFGKLIVKNDNYSHFYAILLLQWVLVLLFFVANLFYCQTSHKDSFESNIFFVFQEIAFIYYKKQQWVFFGTYLFAHVLLYISSMYLLIETLCMFQGITRHELLEPQKHSTFYQNLQEINSFSRRGGQNDGTGTYFRYYENPFSRCR